MWAQALSTVNFLYSQSLVIYRRYTPTNRGLYYTYHFSPQDGFSPMQVSVQVGDLSTVELLLREGAHVDFGNKVSLYMQGFIQRGGGAPWDFFPPSMSSPPPRILKNYDVITLKYEKKAVIWHTSNGNLGAVS